MNRNKTMILGCIVTLVALPLDGIARTEEAGLNACADAMMQDISSGKPAARSYEVKRLHGGDRRRLYRSGTFHLDARGAESDEILARYDCVVNSRAEVIELKVLPLDAENARARSVSMN